MTPPLPSPLSHDSRPATFEKVLAAELQFIRLRLQHLHRAPAGETSPNTAPASAGPAPDLEPRQAALELDLVGLALSGGGIRSATFSLGILQGLASLGLLNRFDYLSTVSGGGYIGGWLAAWMKREGDPRAVEQQLKPNRPREAAARRLLAKGLVVEDEPEPVYHLRAYSNYLSPRLGLLSLDTWTLIAIYLRNLLLNLAVLVPQMLAVVLLCRLLLSGFAVGAVPGPVLAVGGAGAAGLLVFGLAFLGSDLRGRFERRRREEAARGRAGLEGPYAPAAPKGWLKRLLFHGAYTERGEVARLMQILVFLPLLAGSVLLSWCLHRLGDSAPPGYLGKLCDGEPWEVPLVGGLVVGLVFGVMRWLTGIRVVRQAAIHTGRVTRRARFDWITAFYSTLSGFLVGFLFLLLWEVGLTTLSDGQRPPAALTLGPPLVLLLACLAITTEVGLHGRVLEEDAREWWGTVAAYLLIYACCWLALFGLSLYSGWVFERIDNHLIRTGLAASWLAVAVSGVLAGRSTLTFNGQGSPWLEWLGILAPPVFVVGLLTAVALLADAINGPWACLLGLLLSAGLAYTLSSHVDVNLFSMHGTYANRLIRCYLGASRRKRQWRRRDADDPQRATGARLVPGREADGRATLRAPIRHWLPGRGGAPTGNDETHERQDDLLTGFDPDDDPLLSDLLIGKPHGEAQKTYWGPFLLINTALNLVSGEELAWQERKADSFILTPLCGGSKSTGYRWLPPFDQLNPEPCDLTLGRALAISGAAASPNMGYHTSAPLAFLMTVFNVRLGWWMENPCWPNWRARGPVRRAWLLHELLGQTNERGEYVYLSDGGHFENLGVYELVRRRCRYIVACDGDADPQLEFFDLGDLVRKCRNDFGIRIDIDVAPIRHQAANGRSRWHCAVGTIHYGDVDAGAPPGMLIYLKASLTGDEPSDVLAYADQHPSFPHQSTVDQFFTESQFESYRTLGYHIATEVFGDAVQEPHSKAHPARAVADDGTDKRLFSRLRRRWFPPPEDLDAHFLASTKEYTVVQDHLRRDTRLRGLSKDLYPELGDLAGTGPSANGEPPAPSADAGDRDCAELHEICEMLQVMENAWLRLQLRHYHEHPLNRGWMTVFRRWTNTEAFSKYWPLLRGEFSQEFVRFCEEELKLVLWDIQATRSPRRADEWQANKEAIHALAQEFAFEWYSEDTAGRGLKELTEHAERLAERLACDPFVWVIRVTSASKADDDDQLGAGNVARPVGVVLLFETLTPDVPNAGDKFEFFVWILGPYRNQGIGRDPDCVHLALNQVWQELARARNGQPFTLFARYPGEARSEGEQPLERKLWSSFFHYYDFYAVAPEEFGGRNDIILACDSLQHDRRRRTQPLRRHRRQPSRS